MASALKTVYNAVGTPTPFGWISSKQQFRSGKTAFPCSALHHDGSSPSTLSSRLHTFLTHLDADLSHTISESEWDWLVNSAPLPVRPIFAAFDRRETVMSAQDRHNLVVAILWELTDVETAALFSRSDLSHDLSAADAVARLWIDVQFQRHVDLGSQNVYADIITSINSVLAVDQDLYDPDCLDCPTLLDYDSDDSASFSSYERSNPSVLASWISRLAPLSACISTGLTVSNLLDVLADSDFMRRGVPSTHWQDLYDLLILLLLSSPGEEYRLSEFVWPAESIDRWHGLRSRCWELHSNYHSASSDLPLRRRSISRLRRVCEAFL